MCYHSSLTRTAWGREGGKEAEKPVAYTLSPHSFSGRTYLKICALARRVGWLGGRKEARKNCMAPFPPLSPLPTRAHFRNTLPASCTFVRVAANCGLCRGDARSHTRRGRGLQDAPSVENIEENSEVSLCLFRIGVGVAGNGRGGAPFESCIGRALSHDPLPRPPRLALSLARRKRADFFLFIKVGEIQTMIQTENVKTLKHMKWCVSVQCRMRSKIVGFIVDSSLGSKMRAGARAELL